MKGDQNNLSFWEHLDVLRSAILRIIAVWGIAGVVAFVFKDILFDVVFAPRQPDFILYGWINDLCARLGLAPVEPCEISLINTGLARQFVTHVKTAFCAGVLVAAPFALVEIFRFVSPALYSHERRYAVRLVTGGYVMFIFGVALGYFIIFPMTFRFLGTYQVAADVTNLISLESYMGTLITMCLCMGVVCELPVVAWLCARMGLVSSEFMSRYRKHAVVVILTLAAVITPTSDAFTLFVVSLPIWLLYEFSVLLVRNVERSAAKPAKALPA